MKEGRWPREGVGQAFQRSPNVCTLSHGLSWLHTNKQYAPLPPDVMSLNEHYGKEAKKKLGNDRKCIFIKLGPLGLRGWLFLIL